LPPIFLCLLSFHKHFPFHHALLPPPNKLWKWPKLAHHYWLLSIFFFIFLSNRLIWLEIPLLRLISEKFGIVKKKKSGKSDSLLYNATSLPIELSSWDCYWLFYEIYFCHLTSYSRFLCLYRFTLSLFK
jgi:hypothetical protein